VNLLDFIALQHSGEGWVISLESQGKNSYKPHPEEHDV
jgi:hypothetical protein